jgi:ribosomal protein L37E
MNSTFCPNCGVKHTYNYSKPKFCSSCGNALGAVLTQPVKASKTRSIEDDYEDEDFDPENSDSDYIPRITKLQVDIEKDSEYNSFSLGSIFGQGSEPSKTTRRRSAASVDDFVNQKTRRG